MRGTVMPLIMVALGIATLLMQAPIHLSATHQLVATLLFCVAVWRGSTSLIVAGFSLDDYIWASVTLYLDIINL